MWNWRAKKVEISLECVTKYKLLSIFMISDNRRIEVFDSGFSLAVHSILDDRLAH